MIPQRLELTNFLSYRETAVLDFDGIHTACISGANGAGKSSILDGITWALFGNARSRSDDDLVNRLAALDGSAAEVQFTFELESTLYRVIRRKAARKRLILELQVATNSGDAVPLAELQWKTLSERKVRETQEAIEKLLRMNYDTFTNASFLLQGKADEFTTKTPNRRKEILADLLGVSVWEQYKEVAAEQRKGAELELRLLDGRLDDIDTELAEEEARKTAVADIKAESVQLEEQLTLQEKLLNQARQTEAAIAQQQRTVQEGANNVAQAERTLANWQQQQQQRQQERADYDAILAAAAEIVAEFARWQVVEAEAQAWQAKADQFYQLQQQKRPHELAIAQARSRLEQQQQQLRRQAQQVAEAAAERETLLPQQRGGQARLVQLEAELAALATQEVAYQEARLALQQLEAERRLWAQEQAQQLRLAQQVERLQQEKTAVLQNTTAATERLAELTAQLGQVNSQSQRHAVALSERDLVQAEQPRLRDQMHKLKERLDQLREETGSSCPLCGQPLTAAHRQAVLADLQSEGEELGQQFRDNKQRLADLLAEIGQLEGALQEAPRLEREQQVQQQRLAKAEARLAEIDQAVAAWEGDGAGRLRELADLLADETAVLAHKQELAELETAVGRKAALEKERQTQQRQLAAQEARLGEIERLTTAWANEGEAALAAVTVQLERGTYAAEAQAALAELDGQMGAVGYEVAAHEGVRLRLKGLQTAVARQQELRQAEAAVKPLEVALADLRQRLAEQAELVGRLVEQQKTAVAHLENLQANSGDRRAIEDEVFRLREAQISIQRRVGAAQQLVGVLDDLRRLQKQLQADRLALTQRVQRLTLLEKACGRNGVQALLIEQALPDIEDRANELLDRLTGSEMRISFETQKQLKSRDAVAETLDIRISDSAGERPYDNFSGGEQFRVNFAIRLALSQLLAKRAGARLQTLVIDEGFGSQDPNGRQRLIEAINTIQPDFVRILVITHIDELRDAFPTRIEVEKRLTGSQIRVS